LIDEHELVAIDLDARMQPRDQVAADHQVVVVGAADGHVGAQLGQHDFATVECEPQPHRAPAFLCRYGYRRQHAGDVIRLPEHFEQGDFRALTLERRDVYLPHGRLPVR
jgi:hypothetical protein